MRSFTHCILPRTDPVVREDVSVRVIPQAFRETTSYPLLAALMHSLILK